MMKFFQILTCFLPLLLFSQSDKSWYAFYNSDSTKIGFKDAEGIIRIEPKFEPAMTSLVFNDVIAVWEYTADHKSSQYYLNKHGKKFGTDSVYIFDFMAAEEAEGKIKFHDSKTDKVGFFDSNGKIIIPAIYNDGINFNNGIALVLKSAEKKYWDENHNGGCNHWSWVGGKTVAISEQNQEIFEIKDTDEFFSTADYSNILVDKAVNPKYYTTYTGTDGKTYSFHYPIKEFNDWFTSVFLQDFKKHGTVLPKYFYDLVAVSDNTDIQFDTAWKNHDKNEYLNKNQKKVDLIFSSLTNGNFSADPTWEREMNYLYFAENVLPKQDLKKAVTISVMTRSENDYSTANSFQFTKIGDTFFITSAP